MTEPLLRVNAIETFYGPIQAIRGVSAGGRRRARSSPCWAPTAPARPRCCARSPASSTRNAARCVFEGRDIAHMPPDQVMRLGICHVPEGREVFPFLTVRENLHDGRLHAPRHGRRSPATSSCASAISRVLKERAHQRAGLLSGGEQQMLAISRALMGRPKLLLLDEPSLGLSPILVQQIFGIIRRINQEQGVAILLVEQNAHMALKTADYGYVLEVGRIVLADDCATLMQTRRHQGILSRPEGNRRPRPAALEEEAAVALTDRATASPRCSPTRVAAHGAETISAQEGSRHLEGDHLVGARRARARDRHGAAGDRLPPRRRRVRAVAETRPEWVYADLGILGAGGVSGGIDPDGGSRTARPGAAPVAAAACCSSRTRNNSTRCCGARPLSGAAAHRHLRHEGPARLRRSDVREPGRVHRARRQTTQPDWDAGVAAIAADQPAVLLFPRGRRQGPHADAWRYAAPDRQCARHCWRARRRRAAGGAADVRRDGACARAVSVARCSRDQQLPGKSRHRDRRICRRCSRRCSAPIRGSGNGCTRASTQRRRRRHAACSACCIVGDRGGRARRAGGDAGALLVLRAVRRELGLGRLRLAYIGGTRAATRDRALGCGARHHASSRSTARRHGASPWTRATRP